MKKTVTVLFFILMLTVTATAGDFGFVFDGIETNPEFLFDFFPTYYRLGVSYSGLEVIDGNLTELILIGRGGYGHTKLWTDAAGAPVDPASVDIESEGFRDLQSYNNVLLGADIRFQQFLNPAVRVPRGNLAVYAQYGISWMHPLENGTGSYGLDGDATAYPDRSGAVWNELAIGGFLDAVEKGVFPRGYRGEVTATFAPGFFANSLAGYTNYSLIEASFISYFPVFSQSRADGLNLFALYLANRLAGNIVLGDAVPQREQKPVSLGTLMRGFEKNSYGTMYNAVNNFEVRLAGPELFLKDLYPRVNVFFDMGVYAGRYLNSTYSDSGILASAGFEAALTIFNFLSLGYRGAYALKGANMAGVPYTGSIMIDLQF
ncbi:MAG: hypothetical protein JW852_06670 [Spirochaetales bacterium]|nr:hypothetical protein [Spirochaetales bacterium]